MVYYVHIYTVDYKQRMIKYIKTYSSLIAENIFFRYCVSNIETKFCFKHFDISHIVQIKVKQFFQGFFSISQA